MNAKKIGFIGLGLIGGSIAKAIRQYYPDYDIIAFDKNKESLALAIQEGTIHTSCSSIDDNFRGCNYIFLCAPVTYNAAYLSQLKDLLDENCILTDVGSVKTSIHEEVIRLGMEANFIGGHPMAGSEKSGFMNSKAHLIENAYYILKMCIRDSPYIIIDCKIIVSVSCIQTIFLSQYTIKKTMFQCSVIIIKLN